MGRKFKGMHVVKELDLSDMSTAHILICEGMVFTSGNSIHWGGVSINICA